MRILYLPRKIVTLGFDRAGYRALFGTDALADFPRELDRLVTVTPEAVSLTPKGMSGRLPRPTAAMLYDANNSAFDPMG